MLRTITVVSLAASCVALTVSPASATIRPGVGLAHVKIGMTLAQTKKALGKPQTVNVRKQLAGHHRYIEYGWNSSSTWVGFLNTRGVLHAVLMGTNLAKEKTKTGIGVGTPVARVRSLPRAQCLVGTAWVSHPYFDPDPEYRPHCVLPGASGGGRTIFVLNCIEPANSGCHGYTVKQVIVRTSF